MDEQSADSRPCTRAVENLSVLLTCPDCQDDEVKLIEEFSSGDLVCGGCGQPTSLSLSYSTWDTNLCSYIVAGLVLGDKVVDERSECGFVLVTTPPVLEHAHPMFMGASEEVRDLGRLGRAA